MDIEEIKKKAKALALENAIKFKGKANPGAVIGPLMGMFPDFKQNMKEMQPIVNEVVNLVNSMSVEEQKKEFENIGSVKKEKEKGKKDDLPALGNAEVGKVITRMPPGPSKYAHLGHALSFIINYLYAKKYEGKCILRFDDTNPDADLQEYVDAIKKDLIDYLGLVPEKIIHASDDIDKLIGFAEKIIKEGKAYTCNCSSEITSENRRNMKECEHRNRSTNEILNDWSKMKQGNVSEFVLRLKIDMKHKNAVMRDPAIFRVIKNKHYRQGKKYKVWPLYDFESACEDGMNGTTHVLRSNEFDSRIELHNYIAKLFGFNLVEYKHYGRFNILGCLTQGREIRKKIESGEYIGWDDPRLVTLKALRRRGIVKESFYELAKIAGLSKQATNLDFRTIAAINRSILDKTAKRFYCILDPVEINVKGVDCFDVELDLHPYNQKNGRKFSVDGSFLIEKKDFETINGEVRLIDCLNFKDMKMISTDFKDFKGKNKIHWLPNDVSQLVDIEILMDDNTIKKGKAEKNINMIKVDDIIQFERFGFCRLDSIEGNVYKFYFTHN